MMFDGPKFWSFVDIKGPDECWPWLRACDKDGYGRCYDTEHKAYRSHRVAFYLATGSDPLGLIVRHSCDNPPCCNPAHLAAGTSLENVADKMAKGRGNNGIVNGQAKLSDAAVADCRARYVPRHRVHGCHAMAREYGVTAATISMAIRGIVWGHVPLKKE